METQRFKNKARTLRPYADKPMRQQPRAERPREVNLPLHPTAAERPVWHGVQAVRFCHPLPKASKGPMPGRAIDRAKGVEGA